MRLQRTGLTEGTLLYNDWLRYFGQYRQRTENNFINWLYSTSGFYDKDIEGSYFDIDVESVKQSPLYERWRNELNQALSNCDVLDIMVHDDYWADSRNLSIFKESFRVQLVSQYWRDKKYIKKLIKGKKTLVINSFAPLLAEKYGFIPYQTPYTFFNTGPDKNYFETLERIVGELPPHDIAMVSCGAYGSLIADRLPNAIVVGSGLHDMFPVEVPDSYKPDGWEKIDEGKYW